jgi:RNase adapter protein RapZ
MKLIIVSGRSGSGKSTALQVLEDVGFYCIDNLPIGLLFPLTEEALAEQGRLNRIAVSIDARNLSQELREFAGIYAKLKNMPIQLEIIYLDALSQTLLKRFHSTRRKHPLSNDKVSLKEAIAAERDLLEPIRSLADLFLDTSLLSIYELRDQIKLRVIGHSDQELALLFQSFGFKHGVPIDTDLVFDVRCLPNPHWDHALRPFMGNEQPVIEFLQKYPETEEMVQDITRYLEIWLPRFQQNNRSYMTISIGCTGGHHRSVYVAEQLAAHFAKNYTNVQTRHKELPTVSMISAKE